jgi:hypothetical protein
MMLMVLLLVSITGCFPKRVPKDHECKYEVLKLEKDICVWTAEVLTAESINNVKVFDHYELIERQGFLGLDSSYYEPVYKYKQGYQVYINITEDVERNNYWAKQLGYETYPCSYWNEAYRCLDELYEGERTLEMSKERVTPVHITEGTPRIEFHCIFKNVKECSICGEIDYERYPWGCYWVLYYPENDPNFKIAK